MPTEESGMARIPAANMAFAKPTGWTDCLVQTSCLLIGWNVPMEELTGQAGMCLVDADAIPTPWSCVSLSSEIVNPCKSVFRRI